MRQQDDGVLSSPLSSGVRYWRDTPFCWFSHLGNIVEQHWSPHGLYTHFLWYHVTEMMNEPQSGGTITLDSTNSKKQWCIHTSRKNIFFFCMRKIIPVVGCSCRRLHNSTGVRVACHRGVGVGCEAPHLQSILRIPDWFFPSWFSTRLHIRPFRVGLCHGIPVSPLLLGRRNFFVDEESITHSFIPHLSNAGWTRTGVVIIPCHTYEQVVDVRTYNFTCASSSSAAAVVTNDQ